MTSSATASTDGAACARGAGVHTGSDRSCFRLPSWFAPAGFDGCYTTSKRLSTMDIEAIEGREL